jgi:hypothetical protein
VAALTDEDEMREWYFPQLKSFEPMVGYEFQYTDALSSGHGEYRRL